MIYDEGFDINFPESNRSYFLFSKYGKNDGNLKAIKSKWSSYCYSSLVGWYHIGDEWGCLYGNKLGVDTNRPTNGEADNKQVVLEGSITKKDEDQDKFRTNSKLSPKATLQTHE